MLRAKEIAENLRDLLLFPNKEEGLKRFLELLGFGVLSTPEPVRSPEGYENFSARVIARKEEYEVIFVDVERITGQTRRRMRPFVMQVQRKHPWALFVFNDSTSFHFVHPTYSVELAHISSEEVGSKEKFVLKRLVVNDINYLRTPSERFAVLVDGLDGARDTWDVYRAVENAFSVQQLTEEFYQQFKRIHQQLTSLAKNLKASKAREWALMLLSRMMFVYFLQRKRGLLPEGFTLKGFFEMYADTGQKDNFYSWLRALFFHAFKKEQGLINQRQDLPPGVKELLAQMPYLNGGLFEEEDWERALSDIKIPDSVFRDAFNNLLEAYNFTITENAPWDVEVAVDPEMLGRVYESLIAEEERGKAGIFYTPRVEIEIMVRLALARHLWRRGVFRSWERANEVLFSLEEVNLTQEEKDRLSDAVDNIKVVDPAVGSGSFLTAALRVLYELKTHALGGEPADPYGAKLELLRKCIYGVDVKEWAVRVAELRLWLSLIVDTPGEELAHKAKLGPILPNLDFNIRVGDSLLEEVGGIPLIFRGEKAFLRKDIVRGEIKELLRLRDEYFRGQRDLKRAIENQKGRIIRKIADTTLQSLQRENENIRVWLSQKAEKLEGFGASGRKERELLEKRFQENERRIKILRDYEYQPPERSGVFLWEVEFPEVFLVEDRKGFDVVVGNPPYVRQEGITSLFPESPYKGKVYKKWLTENFKGLHGVDLGGRSDYYAYFFALGLSLLDPKGAMAFVTSNSFLDVGYGEKLKPHLLKKGLVLVLDNLVKRTFASSDVNTVITLFDPGYSGSVRFLALRVPFEEWLSDPKPFLGALSREDGEEIEAPLPGQGRIRLRRAETELYRLSVVPRADLQQHPSWKWGGFFIRAPKIFFTILKKGEGKLVRLGDVAEVKFGIKTGANDFFYVRDVTESISPLEAGRRLWEGQRPLAEKEGLLKGEVLDIEAAKERGLRVVVPKSFEQDRHVCFLMEKGAIQPGVDKTEDLASYLFTSHDLPYALFVPHVSFDASTRKSLKMKAPYAYSYVLWGEQMGFNTSRTCKGRPEWWRVGNRELLSKIGFNYNIHERGRWYLCKDREIFYSDNFHVLLDISEKPERVMFFGVSIVFDLFQQIMARIPFGGGKAKIQKYELEELPVTYILHPNIRHAVEEYLAKAGNVLLELGFDPSKPIREQAPNPLPHRKAIDDVVFDALGLTEEERREVYYAVAELVQMRLGKARSVGR